MSILIFKYIPVPIKSTIYARYDLIRNRIKYALKNKFSIKHSIKDTPIIINNFNRLNYLKKLIHSLEKRGYKNIYIIDNQSTYPPLLEWYKNCKYHIFKLNSNIGYTALWDTEIFEYFKDSFYVYTDSDMEIDESCPDDFLDFFFKVMRKYPMAQKVGFGIRIDNIPDCYINKNKVIEHEKGFWVNEVSQNIYKAMIDTTFALYRPYCKGIASPYQYTYRTGKPYLIKHLPWYVDSTNLDDEELYYIRSINKPTHWSKIQQ